VQGYEEGKTFLRRYDNKTEYMIRDGTYAECQRSYLGETMPPPVLPSTMAFQGIEEVEGRAREHWMDDLGVNRIHVFVNADDRLPWRVTDEQVN
jgi:hypothetical protein